MDIAGLSVALSQSQTMNKAALAVMGKTMDVTEELAAGLIAMLNQSPAPSFGHTLDIRA